jgi:hypothetical protein
MPVVETGIAFVAVMLAASLLVSALVQLVQGWLNYRGESLSQMLRTVIRGFLLFHNDADALAAEQPKADPKARERVEACALAFVRDVLTDPSLHARHDAQQYADDPEKLAALVDYLNPDDLIVLANNYAQSYPPGKHAAGVPVQPVANAKVAPATAREAVEGAETPLPVEWVGASEDGSPKPWATTANFAAYVLRWFPTIEATHAQEFKRKIRRLTIGLSSLLVVLFCMDAFQLGRALWQSRTGRAAMVAQGDALEVVAARLGVAGATRTTDAAGFAVERDATTKDVALEIQKLGAMLDDAGIGIGWQNAWITRRWCAFRGACADPPPSVGRLIADAALWLLGLFVSCVLLSLGAPFWVSTFSRLIRMRNEVEVRRGSNQSQPSSSSSSS